VIANHENIFFTVCLACLCSSTIKKTFIDGHFQKQLEICELQAILTNFLFINPDISGDIFKLFLNYFFVLTGSLYSYTCRKGTHTTLNHFLRLWLSLGLDQCKHSLRGCRMSRRWCPLNSPVENCDFAVRCHMNENLFPFLGPDHSTPPHK